MYVETVGKEEGWRGDECRSVGDNCAAKNGGQIVKELARENGMNVNAMDGRPEGTQVRSQKHKFQPLAYHQFQKSEHSEMLS